MNYELIQKRMDSLAQFSIVEIDLRMYQVLAYGRVFNVILGHMNPNSRTQLFIFQANDTDMKSMELLGSDFYRWGEDWSPEKFLRHAISLWLHRGMPKFKIDDEYGMLTVAWFSIDNEVAVHVLYDALGNSELKFVGMCKTTDEEVDIENYIKQKY